MIALFLSALMSQGMAMKSTLNYIGRADQFHMEREYHMQNRAQWDQKHSNPHKEKIGVADCLIWGNQAQVKTRKHEFLRKSDKKEIKHFRITSINKKTSAELNLAPDQMKKNSGKKTQYTIKKEIENAQKNTCLEQKYAGQATSAQQTHANLFYQLPKTRIILQQKIASVSDALRGWENAPKEEIRTQRERGEVLQASTQEPVRVRGKKHFEQPSETTHKRIFG